MIELDVVNYLKNDAQLDTLLGSSGSDSKIYPIQKPITGLVPYIIYSVVDEGTTDENMLSMTISFECVDDNYSDLISLTNRMFELLDNQDQINIPSTDYYIYWSKVVGGGETKDAEFNYFHKTLNVRFLFHRKVRW